MINKGTKTANSPSGNKIEISIVIPVYNEEDNVWPLYDNLEPVLSKLGRNYEVILVDDGSKDDTYNKLRQLHEKNNHFKVIKGK
ncbi:MAG: glycosyltransferase, partial [Actinobacteria bacterium]|nr:glycosyltransferase [Actinomycetota bacterium]